MSSQPSFSAWFETHPYQPPNAETGDMTADEIFNAVGRVTHAWETLESSLQQLFLVLIEPSSSAGIMAYGTVVSSGGRCDMILQACNGYVWKNKRDELIKELKSLIVRVRRLSTLRNIVAHGMVAKVVASEEFQKRNPNYRIAEGDYFASYIENDIMNGEYFLTPAFYNTTKTTERRSVKIWYNSEILKEIDNAILAVKLEIDIFIYHRLLGKITTMLPTRATAIKAISTPSGRS